MAGVMFFGLINTTSSGLIGIDLGAYAIKAIAISNARGIYQVDAVIEVLLPKGVIVDNHLQDISKITTALKQLKNKLPIHYSNVVIAVTGSDVMTKVMPINSTLNDVELENQIEIEVENIIPFPSDEVFIDFEVLGVNEDDAILNNVLVSTARKESVLTHVQCVDEAGFKTKIVDIASHALARAANFLLPVSDHEQSTAIIDIGTSHMLLNIIHQGNVIFSRNKNHGGEVCTQMIAERYGISLQEAEAMKQTCRFPEDGESDVLTPFIDQTIHYLHSELHMFASASNDIKVTRMIVAGAGGLLPGFLQRLESEINIEVIRFQCHSDLKFKNPNDCALLEQSGSKYMMALGLALREVEHV